MSLEAVLTQQKKQGSIWGDMTTVARDRMGRVWPVLRMTASGTEMKQLLAQSLVCSFCVILAALEQSLERKI